jgi:hypothetical protein
MFSLCVSGVTDQMYVKTKYLVYRYEREILSLLTHVFSCRHEHIVEPIACFQHQSAAPGPFFLSPDPVGRAIEG